MKYKTRIKHDMMECLVNLISEYLAMEYTEMDDKLIMAALAEIKHKMQIKLLSYQADYGFSFSPVQAIAISIWFDDFIGDHTTQAGIKLHNISTEIKQQFI